MKMAAATITFVVCCVGFIASAEKPTRSEISIESRLSNLVRVTKKPHKMKPAVSAACAPAFSRDVGHQRLLRTTDAVIHVYVSPEAQVAMSARDATPFPIGTLILKQKFNDSSARDVVLYTGMLKQPQGYNPDCGDWEFFTLSADAKTITSQGRIESCMACHRDYAATDFVTKQYPVER
jgi:hypothetical protein